MKRGVGGPGGGGPPPGPGRGGAILLDPHVLERLGGLELAARIVVEGLRGGAHRAPFPGRGEDFHKHRAYQQGDDLRYLDWKLLARTDRPWIREYRENTTLRCWILVDATRSMGYASPGGNSKLRVAALVAAVLSHLMLEVGDSVGLASLSEEVALLLPPRNRPGQRREILRTLELLRPLGSASTAGALDRVGEALPRRGRVILLSDLLDDDPQGVLVALGRMAARGDEVVAVQLLTPEETGEAPLPPAFYVDPEHPEGGQPASPGADPAFRARVAAHSALLEEGCRGRGVEFVRLEVGLDPVTPLADWLRRRGSR